MLIKGERGIDIEISDFDLDHRLDHDQTVFFCGNEYAIEAWQTQFLEDGLNGIVDLFCLNRPPLPITPVWGLQTDGFHRIRATLASFLHHFEPAWMDGKKRERKPLPMPESVGSVDGIRYHIDNYISGHMKREEAKEYLRNIIPLGIKYECGQNEITVFGPDMTMEVFECEFKDEPNQADGIFIDAIGNMFGMDRLIGESNQQLRKRILETALVNKLKEITAASPEHPENEYFLEFLVIKNKPQPDLVYDYCPSLRNKAVLEMYPSQAEQQAKRDAYNKIPYDHKEPSSFNTWCLEGWPEKDTEIP